MTGLELLAALKKTGTGEPKLRAGYDVVRANRSATAEDVRQAFIDQRASTITLEKIAEILQGSSTEEVIDRVNGRFSVAPSDMPPARPTGPLPRDLAETAEGLRIAAQAEAQKTALELTKKTESEQKAAQDRAEAERKAADAKAEASKHQSPARK